MLSLMADVPSADRARMISTASRNMSWRTSALGQPPPTMCSLRFSPAPSPSENRPRDKSCMVAAFWAITAGWYRRMGQVTKVMSGMTDVAWAAAPRTDQA